MYLLCYEKNVLQNINNATFNVTKHFVYVHFNLKYY